jgi:hypothetical protein
VVIINSIIFFNRIKRKNREKVFFSLYNNNREKR